MNSTTLKSAELPGSIAILLADEDEIIPNRYSLNLFDSLRYRNDSGHLKMQAITVCR